MTRARLLLPAALLLLIGVVVLARLTPPVVTTADIAVTELYTDLASHGRLLVGPYSRFGWHHPGPIYFYLQAPLYAVSGRAGAALFAGAAAINVFALGLLLWTTVAQRRPILALCAGGMLLLFAFRVPRLLASPWTAHVTVLPALAGIALGATIASGRTRLLALMAFVVSFVVQTDLAFVPSIAAVVAVTMGAVAFRAMRERTMPIRDLLIAAAVSAAVWWLPVADAIRNGGGNLAAVWRFFAMSGKGLPSTSAAFVAWSGAFAGVVRPELTLPWGGHLGEPPGPIVVGAASTLLFLLALASAFAARAHRIFNAWLAAITVVAAVAGFWALTRVRGDILDHEAFWLSAAGTLAAGLIIGIFGEAAFVERSIVHRIVLSAAALVPLAAAALAFVHFENFVGFERRSLAQRDIPPAVAAIEGFLDERNLKTTVCEMDTAWAQGVPIVLRLRQDQRRVAVDAEHVFMFTEALASTGHEEVRLSVLPGRRAPAGSGWELVFDSSSVSVYARR